MNKYTVLTKKIKIYTAKLEHLHKEFFQNTFLKNQALFYLKDKSKKLKCLLQFLFGALRIKENSVIIFVDAGIIINLT